MIFNLWSRFNVLGPLQFALSVLGHISCNTHTVIWRTFRYSAGRLGGYPWHGVFDTTETESSSQMTALMPTNWWGALYSFAGHGLRTWKKDSIPDSTPGPVILGKVFVFRGGLAYSLSVFGCLACGQTYGYLILDVLRVLGHHSLAKYDARLYI